MKAALVFVLLLSAPDPAANEVPQVRELLKAGETAKALGLLKEIGEHKKNHEEAKALVKLVRSSRPVKAPEVMEACFLALKGIGSREVTASLVALFKTKPLSKDPAVRIGICRALGGAADPAAVDALKGRMRDKDDHVIAAAAEAAGAYRYAKESVRKELFKTILDIYGSTWNQKNSVNPDQKVAKGRAERKWEIVEKSMEKSMQLLSNITQNDPPAWRRWWNKNKKRRWAALER